jgi:RNA polymerase sigma factor (sigma-70 family)
MNEPPSDDDLFRAFGQGEPVGERLFIERFRPYVFSICYRFLGDQHLAEDAAQEVWKRAVRNLDSFDRQQGNVAGWLAATARNVARDLIRRTKVQRRHTGGDFALAERFQSALEGPTDPDVLARLQEEIRRLPSDQQAALMLVNAEVAWPGQGHATLAGAAEALDYRNGNDRPDHNRVYRLLESAHKALRRQLAEKENQ